VVNLLSEMAAGTFTFQPDLHTHIQPLLEVVRLRNDVRHVDLAHPMRCVTQLQPSETASAETTTVDATTQMREALSQLMQARFASWGRQIQEYGITAQLAVQHPNPWEYVKFDTLHASERPWIQEWYQLRQTMLERFRSHALDPLRDKVAQSHATLMQWCRHSAVERWEETALRSCAETHACRQRFQDELEAWRRALPVRILELWIAIHSLPDQDVMPWRRTFHAADCWATLRTCNPDTILRHAILQTPADSDLRRRLLSLCSEKDAEHRAWILMMERQVEYEEGEIQQRERVAQRGIVEALWKELTSIEAYGRNWNRTTTEQLQLQWHNAEVEFEREMERAQTWHESTWRQMQLMRKDPTVACRRVDAWYLSYSAGIICLYLETLRE